MEEIREERTKVTKNPSTDVCDRADQSGEMSREGCPAGSAGRVRETPWKTLILGLFIVIGLTAFSGAMQGRLAHRWGPPEELIRAGERLAQFPLQCGDWVAEKDMTLSDEEILQLEPAGYLFRRYTHERTGEQVTVTILVGPTGPIAVHSPEICFSSRTYQQDTKRAAVPVGSPQSDDRLWSLRFKSRKLEGDRLQVYYGWSTGSGWSAAADARYAFARFPYLYKIQLAGYAGDREVTDPKYTDACGEFLKVFLPEVTEYLVDPTKSGS